MTDKEIMKQVLLKANYNPFEGRKYNIYELGDGSLEICCEEEYFYEEKSINDIIFSHEFAKAFWKDYPLICKKCNGTGYEDEWEDDYGSIIHIDCKNCFLGCIGKTWELYLKDMVLEEEPLKYLEKFL